MAFWEDVNKLVIKNGSQDKNIVIETEGAAARNSITLRQDFKIRKHMKQNVMFLACMLLSLAAWPQGVTVYTAADAARGDSIDRVKYEVVYDLRGMVPAVPDSIVYDERMLLQIGERASAFYSYAAYQVDSMVAEQIKRRDNLNIRYTAKVNWRLYKNCPTAGKTVFLDRVANDRYVVEEDEELPAWSLVADSAKEVLGYQCHLAVAAYKGRTWSAWYTDDIPIDNGPWKLQGLPGLILQAYDEGREFVFTAVGMMSVATGKTLEYKGKSFTPIDRKSLNKIYKRYYADAIGYTLMSYPSSSRSSIKITDGEGNELKHSKPMPYNLIER